jgi:hypothetical protein
MVKDLMGSDEKVELEVVEHRLGGARFFDPAHAFATTNQIIIVRRGPLGIHRDYKIIRYESITQVKIERGPIFCKLHFNLLGEQESDDLNEMKWLVGLKYKDALALIHIVNSMEEKPVQEVKGGSDTEND